MKVKAAAQKGETSRCRLAEEEEMWAEGALLESARYGRKEVNAEDYEGQSEASIAPMRESPGALPGPPRALQQGVPGATAFVRDGRQSRPEGEDTLESPHRATASEATA